MIHPNKKTHTNGFKSPSKVSLIRSKSTEHLTSAHKSISRKNAVDKVGGNDLLTTKIKSLNKTKSTKSLKSKPKSLIKNTETKSVKKQKPKVKKNVENDCKTVKKGNKLIKIQFSDESFTNSDQSVKAQPFQYFFYHNTYIPIENSAQRRFVFKIREIDQQVESTTSDTFFKKNYESIALQKDERFNTVINKDIVATQDNCVETEKTQIIEIGTSMTPRINNQISLQTQAIKFQEDIKKCFSTTLEDLQFLFLPEETHFQGFSRVERLHYKELFESIGQKIWANGQNLQDLTPETIQVLVYQRECVQMGMLEFYPEEGFPTHIFAVMSYLTNLFCFVQMNEKSEALQKIHSIYGFGYQERLSRLLRGVPTKKKCSSILSEELFMALEDELFKDHEFGSETVEKSVHIHNKAIFDAANEELEKFKPFYYSKGQPFPWSVNVGMTFFSIDESTLGLLFKQIKEKVLMKFGSLCGLLVDYDEFKELPNKQKHPVHIKKLQQQELKMVNEQLLQQKYEAEIQQTDVSLRAEISTSILGDLIEDFCLGLLQLQA